MEEQQHEEEDQFKRLPDDLLRHILCVLRSVDVRAMGRCLAVSKRFRSLVPLMTSFSIPIPIHSVTSDYLRQSCSCYLDRYMDSHGLELAPIFHADEVVRLLEPFPEIRNLNMDAGSADFDCCHAEGHGSVVLKLKAELGFCDPIKSCVILAATSLQRKGPRPGDHDHSSLEGLVGELNGEDHPQPPLVTLPSRGDDYEVMHIISCVMSWMERILLVHSAVRQIVPGHPMLHEVVVKDSGGKVVLHVGKAEISTMRSRKRVSIHWKDGLVDQSKYILPLPKIESEMWFVRELVLPESGYVMRGATLWVSSTRANDAGAEGNNSYGDIVGSHFDEDINQDLRRDSETKMTTTSPVLEAVREMRKKMDTKPCTVKMLGTEIIKLDRHLPCQGIELMSVSSSIA